MGKRFMVPGNFPKTWRFFFGGLLLVLLVGLGEIIVQASPGYALSVLMLVLVWAGVLAYLIKAWMEILRG